MSRGKEILEASILAAPGRRREIKRLHDEVGLSLAEIGRREGLTRGRIFQLYKIARREAEDANEQLS